MDYSGRTYLQSLFVDSLADCALVLLDLDGKVLTWNAGAQALHGYSEAEMIGRQFSCLFAQGDVDADKPGISLAAARAQGRHEETRQRLHKDGSLRKVQDVLIPLYDANRKLVAFGNLMRALDASADVVAPRVALVDAAPGQAPPNQAQGLRLVVPVARRRNKVLVVDDDEDVRAVAVDMLTGLGYEVVVAPSGAEALDLLARAGDVDVLFTDVVMPGGMDGGEVADKARELRPGIKVLFTSGYFEGALVRKGSIGANTHFLVKPYRRKDLGLMMEQVLEAEGSGVSGASGAA